MFKTERIIEGFTDEISVFPGETLHFKVRCLVPKFSISFARIEDQRTLLEVKNLKSNKQPIPTNPYLGVNWETSYILEIPLAWGSGLYVASLNAQNSKFFVFFVVKGFDNEIAVLAPNNTWQAYNFWGGGCFYDIHGAKQIPILGVNRPVITSAPQVITNLVRKNSAEIFHNNHILSCEQLLYRWMSKRYQYNVISDRDFGLLKNYKVLVIGCHAEYWSEDMYNQLEAFLSHGGKLIYLGGNAIFWKVLVQNNFIKCDKANHETWRRSERDEARVLGIHYTDTGYTTMGQYKVRNYKHWVFQDTKLANGDIFGKYASGWETDKTSDQTPEDTVLLAKGTNPNYSGADMVCRPNVFSVGSVTYTSCLNDPIISKITENVVERFTSTVVL